ncbi:MAG: lipopolysaccharide biosynthesis protein [Ruminococcaceae bacterium]|nr:lipopolysaccharide biosynthesis protein [Oscillospiraceae bacterium]
MRAEATMKNSMWGLFQQFVICILSLFSRRVMIDTIGMEGVGLNGLLTNVVAVLSLADMGISASIIFHMYKPLANGDENQLSKLMNFYRDVYRIIAAAILAIGLCLMPFMKYIVHDVSYTDGYVRLIYFLFLLQTVTTYLFAYKRSLLSADQKQYIISIFDLVFKIITVIGGIIVLKITNELSYYLLFLIVTAVINNIMIARKVDEMYPYVKNTGLLLEKEHKKSIFKDVKNIFIGRISGTITNSTDNILISALVGTIVTGLYSNYTIILNTLTAVMNQFSYAMTGSIGNLIATETGDYIEGVLKKLSFIMFFMGAFCCVCLSCLIDPFITLAFGDNLLLERYVVYICIAVFYFTAIKIPVWNMMQASGLFKADKYISIAGSAINLVVSFILGKTIGIAGILIGTICTYVVQYNLKIIIFYKKILHKNCIKILSVSLFYLVFTVAEYILMGHFTSMLPFGNPYVKFFASGFLAVAVGAGFNSIVFLKTEEFKYFKDKVFKMLKIG